MKEIREGSTCRVIDHYYKPINRWEFTEFTPFEVKLNAAIGLIVSFLDRWIITPLLGVDGSKRLLAPDGANGTEAR